MPRAAAPGEPGRAGAAWRYRGRRRHVIKTASVLVINHDQQGTPPGRRTADSVVHRGDQLLAVKDVVWRVLVVGCLVGPEACEIARHDKTVIRQSAVARIFGEIILEQAEMRRYIE